MFIDSHAHIFNKEFNADRQEVVDRAVEAGVQRIYMPNVNQDSIEPMLETEAKNSGVCFSMIGLHPCEVDKHFEKQLYHVEDWLKQRPFVAIGEMGLDFYWDQTFKEQQIEAFRIQANLGKQYKLPLVLHTRNATRETIDLVRELKNEELTGIFHCFGGSLDEAKKILELGFLLGIGGVVTFKNSGLDQVLPDLELENLVLETDCPYLAPAPYRGKRNEPAYIPVIARKVAEIMNKTPEEVAEVTTANALKIFQ